MSNQMKIPFILYISYFFLRKYVFTSDGYYVHF